MTKNALQQFLDRYKKLKEDQELRPGKDILTTEFHKIKRESEKLGIDGVTIATVGAKEITGKRTDIKISCHLIIQELFCKERMAKILETTSMQTISCPQVGDRDTLHPKPQCHLLLMIFGK